jgi:hypothetical protein
MQKVNLEPGTRDPKPETRNPKPETSSPKDTPGHTFLSLSLSLTHTQNTHTHKHTHTHTHTHPETQAIVKRASSVAVQRAPVSAGLVGMREASWGGGERGSE